MTSRLLVSMILAFIFAGTSLGQEIGPLLNHNEKFTAKGKVFEDDLYGFPTYSEVGSVKGVAYRIQFLDGSGTFEGVKGNGIDPEVIVKRNIADLEKNWMISCREDAVDTLTCLMVIPGITVSIDTKGQEFVAIHGDGDPRGAIVGIRFDRSENFTGGKESRFEGSTAKQIIERLKSAKQVTTDSRRPASRTPITRTFELYGFNEAFSYVNWVIDKCKRVYNAREGAEAEDGRGFQTCNPR